MQEINKEVMSPQSSMGRLTRKLARILQRSSELGKLCVMLGLSFIPGAVGQYEYNTFSYNSYNCDKYCHTSCSDYFRTSTSEFSTCVSANVHCNCVMKLSGRNPFFLFILVVILMMTCVCCAFCHRTCSRQSNRRRRTPHHIVAQPVMGNGSRRTSSATGAHIIANNGVNANSTSSGRPFIISLGLGGNSATKKDMPPEYMPPPPYNECVINVDPPGIHNNCKEDGNNGDVVKKF